MRFMVLGSRKNGGHAYAATGAMPVRERSEGRGGSDSPPPGIGLAGRVRDDAGRYAFCASSFFVVSQPETEAIPIISRGKEGILPALGASH